MKTLTSPHPKASLTDRLVMAVVLLGVIWVVIAFCFQLFMISLEITGNGEVAKQINDWFYATFYYTYKE